MADDLDQGYMQTRQTMRDWQNRMLFMETTQEGNQVHMGVQVGGKETDGKGVAPTAQPQPETALSRAFRLALLLLAALPPLFVCLENASLISPVILLGSSVLSLVLRLALPLLS